MNINAKDEVCGVPILSVRKLLRHMRWFAIGPEYAADIVALSAQRTGKLLRDLVAAGLVETERKFDKRIRYRTTVTGNALANASAAPMLRRKTAERILAEFQERLRAFDDQGFVYRVVWAIAFGSILGDAPRLSDVDVAVTLEHTDPDSATLYEAGQRRVKIAKDRGKVFSGWLEEQFWPSAEPALYLKAKCGYLSLHDGAEDDVIAKLIQAGRYRVLAGDDARIRLDAKRRLQPVPVGPGAIGSRPVKRGAVS